MHLFGCALALALHEQGWKGEAPLGGGVHASAGDRTIEPFTILPRLATGHLRPKDWRKECARLGIATLALEA